MHNCFHCKHQNGVVRFHLSIAIFRSTTSPDHKPKFFDFFFKKKNRRADVQKEEEAKGPTQEPRE
jgi:hypothetical protein